MSTAATARLRLTNGGTSNVTSDASDPGFGAGGWEDLYRSAYAPMARLAGLLLGDYGMAEEIVQEAFALLIDASRGPRSPEAYLRGTVVNLCRSTIRRRLIARRRQPPEPPVETEDSSDALATHDAVLRALRGLPQRQREAVVLRYYADLSEADAATAMRISPGAVKTHLSRGLASLARQLEDLP